MLMGRAPEIFYLILMRTATFVPNFAQFFFCQILGSVFHDKFQKVPTKGKRYHFWYFFWVLISVVISHKYLRDTINSHKDIRMSGFCARIGNHLTDGPPCLYVQVHVIYFIEYMLERVKSKTRLLRRVFWVV